MDEMKVRGGGVKNFKSQRYKEGTCTKMSHEQDFNTNTNLQAKWSNNSQVKVTSSQRCLDTFVIVTAHKQVCANQKIKLLPYDVYRIQFSQIPICEPPLWKKNL